MDVLNDLMPQIQQYGYFILLPLAVFEGPIVSVVSGILVRLGVFAFLPAYILILLGDIISDYFYYHVGRLGDQTKLLAKYGAKYKIISDNYNTLQMLWANHAFKTMFLAKLSYGFTIPFLISAGLTKMSFRRYFLYTFISSAFKYFVLMILGFYLSYSFKIEYIYYSGLIMASFVITVLVIFKYAGKYLRSRINAAEDVY